MSIEAFYNYWMRNNANSCELHGGCKLSKEKVLKFANDWHKYQNDLLNEKMKSLEDKE